MKPNQCGTASDVTPFGRCWALMRRLMENPNLNKTSATVIGDELKPSGPVRTLEPHPTYDQVQNHIRLTTVKSGCPTPCDNSVMDNEYKFCGDEGKICTCNGQVLYGKKFAFGQKRLTSSASQMKLYDFAEKANTGEVMCGGDWMSDADLYPGQEKHC